jgi:type 1 glutamine amidotransferase
MYDRRTMLGKTMLGLLGGLGLAPLAAAQGVVREPPKRRANVLLVSAESENHSAETLPQLAQQLESGKTMRCQVLAGGPKDIQGIEDIEDADLVILYVDSTQLPASQLGAIQKYANSGKPLVALRSSLQGFRNWNDFGSEVLGARWQFHYGANSTTQVSVVDPKDPMVNGLPPEFPSPSPLYHVLPLAKSCKPLLLGKSVGPSDRTERAANPVAWTNTHKGGRVFYTSLGYAEDFSSEPFRKLLFNAVNWALNR